eukprot:99417-Pyramimonas_sp.AAC.1
MKRRLPSVEATCRPPIGGGGHLPSTNWGRRPPAVHQSGEEAHLPSTNRNRGRSQMSGGANSTARREA